MKTNIVLPVSNIHVDNNILTCKLQWEILDFHFNEFNNVVCDVNLKLFGDRKLMFHKNFMIAVLLKLLSIYTDKYGNTILSGNETIKVN